MLKFAVLLAFVAAAAAGDVPTWVGRFSLEVDPNKSNYDDLLKAAGFKPADIKKFVGMISKSGLVIDNVLGERNRLTVKFSSGAASVANTFMLGVKKEAKLLVGGTAKATVFPHSNSRLGVHVSYGNTDVVTIMDCDDEGCDVVYSAKDKSLLTKWRREAGGEE